MNARIGKVVLPLLRATAVTVVLLLLLATYFYRAARANVSDSLFGMGASLMRVAGAYDQADPHSIVFNGAPIWLTSGTTPAPVNDVLDIFEKRCLDRDGKVLETLVSELRGKLNSAQAAEIEQAAAGISPIMRDGNEDAGFVACLDMGPRVSLDAFVTRVERFAETGELSHVGEFRYVWARRDRTDTERNPTGTTFFVGAYTDGGMNIRTMFPERGDVPGGDPIDVPRPANSRRVMTAVEGETGASITSYLAKNSVDGLADFYRSGLASRSFERLSSIDETQMPGVREHVRTLVYIRGDRTVAVTMAPSEPDEKTGAQESIVTVVSSATQTQP